MFFDWASILLFQPGPFDKMRPTGQLYYIVTGAQAILGDQACKKLAASSKDSWAASNTLLQTNIDVEHQHFHIFSIGKSSTNEPFSSIFHIYVSFPQGLCAEFGISRACSRPPHRGLTGASQFSQDVKASHALRESYAPPLQSNFRVSAVLRFQRKAPVEAIGPASLKQLMAAKK